MGLLVIENFVDWNESSLVPEGVTVGGTIDVDATYAPRANCNSMLLQSSEAAAWPISSAPSTIRFAMRVYFMTRQTYFFRTREGANDHVVLGVDSSGYLYAYRGTLTSLGTATIDPIPESTWTHIEGKIVIADGTSGSVEVRVNGSATPALNITGVDTRNGATGVASSIVVGEMGTGRTLAFTDFVVWDESGEAPTGWIGDSRVDTYLPTGAGSSTEFTPSAGSNWECVDEQNTDTSYVESSANADLDLYTFGDMLHTPSTIHAVAVTAVARKTDAGSGAIKLTMKSGATTAQSASEALSDASYNRKLYARGVDPNTSSAWTQSAINALEAGVESVL